MLRPQESTKLPPRPPLLALPALPALPLLPHVDVPLPAVRTVEGDGVQWLTGRDSAAVDAVAERLTAQGRSVGRRTAHVAVTFDGQTAHHYNRLVARRSGDGW